MGGLLSICRHINSTLIVIFTVFLLSNYIFTTKQHNFILQIMKYHLA